MVGVSLYAVSELADLSVWDDMCVASLLSQILVVASQNTLSSSSSHSQFFSLVPLLCRRINLV